jgi:tRNA_anti-like
MRKWVIILILILVLAFVGYNCLYQDHRDINKEQPEYIVTSASINDEFLKNSVSSEKKYQDKTIIVSGIISELNQNSVTLDGKVFCQFTKIINRFVKINTKIKIKGRFIGYDDLIEQVRLDQCSLID